MADLVIAAMASIIPKLHELLKEEYSLQTGMKERISSLTKELDFAQASLHKVAQVPWDELGVQAQLWARDVMEASYDMEDVLDTFLLRVEGLDFAEQEQSLLKPLKKISNLFKKSKARHKISSGIKDIMAHLQEVTERCRRYKVQDIVVRPSTASIVDPRLHAMYNKVKNLVGMNKSSSELMSMLQNPQRDDTSSTNMKVVSIVGVGGLGKTTLAKAVYDKLKGDFDCSAFVPVGRKPDLKKTLKDILIDLDKQKYLHFSTAVLDARQLIDELLNFLKNKRYLIVIDDIWEIESWETIKLAMDDDNDSGGRIIITTRKLDVATNADKVYKLQPLSYDSSRQLFFARTSAHQGKSVSNLPDEILDKFIRKCSGVPLAIITMASLLVGKQREEWPELYNTIDFGTRDNKEAENTMKILSLSYYDLPSHLRTCLLYLSAFPEDSVIPKETLVWMWVAEGFIHQKKRVSLYETGEGYFNDLINRSMIQRVESDYDDNTVIGCRVHDMMLDFISSMSREENFFTVLDDDYTLMLKSNVRRLANNNSIIWDLGYRSKMHKLRSYIARNSYIETRVPLSKFTFLRVLAIENCSSSYDSSVRVEDLKNLLQLRFLSLCGTLIGRIPEEIGALRFLQTLDLRGSGISEFPSSSVLPKLLACLRITVEGNAFDGKVFSVKGMTCLEELLIHVRMCNTRSCLLKDLSCLRELRVLDIFRTLWDEEGARDLVESLRHLQKLQSLRICGFDLITTDGPSWQATELVIPRCLRYLAVDCIEFSKLPSCITPSCLNLSHLDLKLECIDEKGLKILGALPDLRYLALELGLWSPATILNISDSDACYFPELRFCKLSGPMLLFVTNKENRSVSVHIWNGLNDISMPSVSEDELQRARPSVSNALKSKDKLQSPMPSVSHDDELDRPPQSIKGRAAAPRIMPSLQVLHFEVYYLDDIPKLLDNLGWEHLSSLQEINVDIYLEDVCKNILETALRRAAEVHPNHPTVHINILEVEKFTRSPNEREQYT